LDSSTDLDISRLDSISIAFPFGSLPDNEIPVVGGVISDEAEDDEDDGEDTEGVRCGRGCGCGQSGPFRLVVALA